MAAVSVLTSWHYQVPWQVQIGLTSYHQPCCSSLETDAPVDTVPISSNLVNSKFIEHFYFPVLWLFHSCLMPCHQILLMGCNPAKVVPYIQHYVCILFAGFMYNTFFVDLV